MKTTNEITKTISVAIVAVLFSATMVLSAVGPAEARAGNGHTVPRAASYLA